MCVQWNCMKCLAEGKTALHIRAALIGAKYREDRTRDGFVSYKKSFHPVQKYPRYHIILHPHQSGTIIDLHIDQRSYDGKSNRNQNWCHRGLLVEEELQNIKTKLIEPQHWPPKPRPNSFLKILFHNGNFRQKL